MQAGGGAGATCWDHLQPATIIITDYTLPAALAAWESLEQVASTRLSYFHTIGDELIRQEGVRCIVCLGSGVISSALQLYLSSSEIT